MTFNSLKGSDEFQGFLVFPLFRETMDRKEFCSLDSELSCRWVRSDTFGGTRAKEINRQLVTMESPLRIVGEVKKDSPVKTAPAVSGVVETAEIADSGPLGWYHTWLCVRNGDLSVHQEGLSDEPFLSFSLAGARVARTDVEDWPLAFKVDKSGAGLVFRFESPEEFSRWAKSISMEVLRYTKLEEVKSLEIMGESDRSAAVKQYMKQRENWENSAKENEKEDKINIESDKTKDEVDYFGYESCEFESFSFEELEMNRKIYFDNPKTKIVDFCKRLPTIVEKADMVNELKEVFTPDTPLRVKPEFFKSSSPEPRLNFLKTSYSPEPQFSSVKTNSPEPHLPSFKLSSTEHRFSSIKTSSPEPRVEIDSLQPPSSPERAGTSRNDVRIVQQEYNIIYDEKSDDHVKAWNGPYILQKEEKEVLENINNVFLTRRKCAREEWILSAIRQVVSEHEEKIWDLQERLAKIDDERFQSGGKSSANKDSYEALERQLQEEEAYLQEAQAAARVQEKLVQDLSTRFEVALSKGLHDLTES